MLLVSTYYYAFQHLKPEEEWQWEEREKKRGREREIIIIYKGYHQCGDQWCSHILLKAQIVLNMIWTTKQFNWTIQLSKQGLAARALDVIVITIIWQPSWISSGMELQQRNVDTVYKTGWSHSDSHFHYKNLASDARMVWNACTSTSDDSLLLSTVTAIGLTQLTGVHHTTGKTDS